MEKFAEEGQKEKKKTLFLFYVSKIHDYINIPPNSLILKSHLCTDIHIFTYILLVG